MEADHIAWSDNLFRSMRQGMTWAIPRSGLMFRKDGDAMVLYARMPWMPEMEGDITPEQLLEQQAGDYDAVKAHFEAAGIPVRSDIDPQV